MALVGLPLIIGSIIGGLAHAVGSLVGRVLISLGITFVTYNGIDTMMEWVRGQALSRLSTLPANVYNILELLQIPGVINIYFSAWAASLVLTGMQGGAFTRMVQGAPGGGGA